MIAGVRALGADTVVTTARPSLAAAKLAEAAGLRYIPFLSTLDVDRLLTDSGYRAAVQRDPRHRRLSLHERSDRGGLHERLRAGARLHDPEVALPGRDRDSPDAARLARDGSDLRRTLRSARVHRLRGAVLLPGRLDGARPAAGGRSLGGAPRVPARPAAAADPVRKARLAGAAGLRAGWLSGRADLASRQLDVYREFWPDIANLSAFWWGDGTAPLRGLGERPALRSAFRRLFAGLLPRPAPRAVPERPRAVAR